MASLKTEGSGEPEQRKAVMDPMLLRKDEMTYELKIRSLLVFDHDTHLHLVNRALENADTPVNEDKVEALDANQEFLEMRPKVFECETLVAELLSQTLTEANTSRVTSLYVHLTHRLRRIVYRANGSVFDDLKTLGRRVANLHDKLSPLYPDMTFPYLFIPDDDVTIIASKVTKMVVKDEKLPEKSSKDIDSSSSSSQSSSNSSRSSRSSRSSKQKKKKEKKKKKKRYEHKWRSEPSGGRPKMNPVTKWTQRYSRGEDLPKFLEDVEEQANIHSVTDGELLRGLSSLLTGDAEVWYRDYRDSISSWEDCKKAMKKAFAPADNDESVLEKISSLKQKTEETYVVFEAKMKQLFHRLTEPLSEKQKVKKVLAGLHVYYRSRIRSADISSLRDLALACQGLEEDKPHILKLERDEEKKREMKTEKRFPKVNALEPSVPDAEASVKPRVEVAAAAPIKGSAMQCWKCSKFGHFAKDCTERVSCAVCGLPDTVAAKCTNCAQARAMGYWFSIAQQPSNRGNMTRDWIRGNSVPGNSGVAFPPPLHQPPPQVQLAQRATKDANAPAHARR